MTTSELRGVQELGRSLGFAVEALSVLTSDPPQYEVRLRRSCHDSWHRFINGLAAMLYMVKWSEG